VSFRHISVFCILIFFIFPAADADAQLFKGIIGGWNLSNFSYEDGYSANPDYQSKNGYCVGLFAGGPISGVFGLRAEILYTRKGAQYDFTYTDENGQSLGQIQYSEEIDYLEIPLLANFTIPTSGTVKPALFLGPAIDFEMSAKLKATYPRGVVNKNQSDQDLENTTSPDFSLIVGGGIEIESGPHLILVQVRYVMGLKDVYRSASNRVFSVMAGFGI
jgi:hypothetical protein